MPTCCSAMRELEPAAISGQLSAATQLQLWHADHWPEILPPAPAITPIPAAAASWNDTAPG